MATLSELVPTRNPRLIDLVQEAKVDTSDWARFRGGTTRAAANPKYCYEWAFVQPGKVIVLNLWLDDIREYGRFVEVRLNMRRISERTDAKPVWRERALRVDRAMRAAFEDGLGVRVIVVAGVKRKGSGRLDQASRVKRKVLDLRRWAVVSYDVATGQAVVRRGATPTRHVLPKLSSTRRPSTGWPQADKRVEVAAVKRVSRGLRSRGYLITSREDDNCGYDLHASRGTEELHVEVKGCRGSHARFFLSRNELTVAKTDRRWRIGVVTDALTHPRMPPLLSRREMEKTFQLEPIQWEGTLSS